MSSNFSLHKILKTEYIKKLNKDILIVKKDPDIIDNILIPIPNDHINTYLNNDINNDVGNDVGNDVSNIIISLTSVPDRIVQDNFIKVLESLFEQILKPKYVILHVCNIYIKKYSVSMEDVEKKLLEIKKLFPMLIINRTPDMGPATKLIGMLYINNIDADDRIIVVDDDCPMRNDMTLHYELCYQLYNCDCVFVNERDILLWNSSKINGIDIQPLSNIYYNNYQNFAYGWLSFSFKKRFITNELAQLLNTCIKQDYRLLYHDDLFFTLYYRTKKLNACGINMVFNNITVDAKNIMDTGLHIESNASKIRYELEKIFTQKYGIDIMIKNSENYIVNKKTAMCEYNIQKNINKRYLLRNIDNLDYDRSSNVHDLHLDLKHFNKDIIIVTVTKFNPSNNEDTFLLSNNSKIKIYPNNYSSKQSYFFNMENDYELWPSINKDVIIYQTNATTNISLNRFNSICTILSYIPYLKYKIFDDNDIISFIRESYPSLLNVYNKLRPGAYKADMFRALYGYKNGGIYFDCKQILFISLLFIFKYNRILVKDIKPSYIYNAMFYIKAGDAIIKRYLVKMISNIINSDYTVDALSITGPGVFANIIDKVEYDNYILYNTLTHNNINNHQTSIIKIKNTIIIKNSYYGYYDENNYQTTKHYSVMWNNKTVYNRVV